MAPHYGSPGSIVCQSVWDLCGHTGTRAGLPLNTALFPSQLSFHWYVPYSLSPVQQAWPASTFVTVDLWYSTW